MSAKILILGGYGNTGRILAELLLAHTDTHLVIAGRSAEKAAALAAKLNEIDDDNRVTSAAADAADPASLHAAFIGVGLVVVASSTSDFAQQVAESALSAGIDYFDVQFSTAKLKTLQAMQERITEAGCCFISEGGFHPGLPAALVRYAATQFDSLEGANVASVIKLDWASYSFSNATMREFVAELMDFESLHFKDGMWQKANWWRMQQFHFDAPFGQQPAFPMMLEEMRPLPQMIHGLKETGFFVGGFNPVVDYLVTPLAVVALKLWPRRAVKPTGALLGWGLSTFSRPPYGTVLLMEARGQRDGQPAVLRVTISHEDAYVLTAAPVAACLLQVLDGTIREPGLWLQALVADPVRLLEDMQHMGVTVEADAVPA